MVPREQYGVNVRHVWNMAVGSINMKIVSGHLNGNVSVLVFVCDRGPALLGSLVVQDSVCSICTDSTPEKRQGQQEQQQRRKTGSKLEIKCFD